MKNNIQYIWNDIMSFLQSNLKHTADHSIAYQILLHMDDIPLMKIEEFALLANVSPGTISKFCQKIGISGFNQLKEILTDYKETRSYLIDIKSDFPKHQYEDAFQIYDSRITMQLINLLDKSQSTKRLCNEINKDSNILILTPSYAMSPSISFARICKEENINSFVISRSSESDIIFDFVDSSDIIIIISSSGTWTDTVKPLLHKLNNSKKDVYFVGSNLIQTITNTYDNFVPITIADSRHLLDFHYSSERMYSLFFAYVSLKMNIL